MFGQYIAARESGSFFTQLPQPMWKTAHFYITSMSVGDALLTFEFMPPSGLHPDGIPSSTQPFKEKNLSRYAIFVDILHIAGDLGFTPCS